MLLSRFRCFGFALTVLALMRPGFVLAQSQGESWQNPPEPILSMLETPALPGVVISPDNRWLVEVIRPPLPPIAQLVEPVVAIAGYELNPKTWGPAREFAYEGLSLRAIGAETSTPIALPPNPRIRNFNWSRDNRYLSFTLTQADGIELWVLDTETAQAKQLTGPSLNATLGDPCRWLPEDQGLICLMRLPGIGNAPEASQVPQGPIVEATTGRAAPARTYTNLLASPHDERLLEYYFRSQPTQVGLQGELTAVGQPDLVWDVKPSGDGQWLLRSTYHRPFSYQVPLSRFPLRHELLNRQGELVQEIADLPLADNIPVTRDSVRQGKRSLNWRHDQPATLYWLEALDGGDSRQPADYRDALFELPAPFTREPRQLWRSTLRLWRVTWGNEQLALVNEGWSDSRQLKTWQIDPSAPEDPARLLFERNFRDVYSDPGRPVTAPGPYGWSTLLLGAQGLENSLYLNGFGASPEGVYPFLDRYDLATRTKQRLWQAQGENFARVQRVLGADANQLMIRRQSPTEPPNYYQVDLAEATEAPLTQFEDPLAWYGEVQKEVVRYRREDGVELSATLYLPPGYDAQRDGPLPTLFWVYPEEFKDRQVASQVTESEYTFDRPGRTSVLFLLTQGYAVLDGPTMPIIGEGDREPNDRYLEQLTMSAEAAVDYVVERGVSDSKRLAIGGHSYGAFTVANILAHSELFQAGIARSGAYNRSLTPFGFQGEQRNFWEAKETYIKMSPFFVADQINEPLLLIHGTEDNNSGTYPIQSERLYEAMRGLGGTVRYVSLPGEGHGYRSREAAGHVLWEMLQWLEQHLGTKASS